ncbi:MAG TPA: permease [Sedimentisphaerales bacterium]|nr:permease [Sedimentisphaerales bacterium]HRS12571.1 permease [Sedimentisphaerales bacterium]HRV49181.1 permease [Sedimentisphaerales bacterium]
MDWKSEWRKLAAITVVFLVFFWLPVGWDRFTGGIMEALHLAKWYAREHVLLCLVPAFFIAGAIGVFISQASVMKYLGAKANKVLAYGVASVSGSILAVCSCTVLPLFAGIWRMGAGLGPATAFLYSGPAINVLAIILTARILGLEIGIARAVGAISFSVIIGLIMHLIYRKEELEKANGQMGMPEPEVSRPLAHNALFFFVMVGILVFANWGAPNDWRIALDDGTEFRAAITKAPEDAAVAGAVYRVKMLEGPDEGQEVTVDASRIIEKAPLPGTWTKIWQNKWLVTAGFAAAFSLILILWFSVQWWKIVLAAIAPVLLAFVLPTGGLWVLVPFSAGIVGVSMALASSKGEGEEWFGATWTFAKQILPLLFFGVLVAGFLLGRPDHEGFIPSKYVEMLVGDSPNKMLEITGWGGGGFASVAHAIWPLWTNFFASVFGALMYFATLTEVPILQGLVGAGMGKGPALALLLAGPALSLPNMLVIRSIMGTQKTVVFVSLVVVMATISGMVFGAIF